MISGGQPDRVPVMPITMMFAADRIGARYRDYASDYRVLVEGQLATAETFGLDYVSAISDPAREASARSLNRKHFSPTRRASSACRKWSVGRGCATGLRRSGCCANALGTTWRWRA